MWLGSLRTTEPNTPKKASTTKAAYNLPVLLPIHKRVLNVNEMVKNNSIYFTHTILCKSFGSLKCVMHNFKFNDYKQHEKKMKPKRISRSR